jgi:hypothetical protein
MKKENLILIAVAVVLLGAVLFWSSRDSGPGGSENDTPVDMTKPSDEARVIKQDLEAVLSGFPEGFPVEPGAYNTDSFQYVPANSLEQQSTVQYISKKTLRENEFIFSEFLEEAGFEIANELIETNEVFLYATKDSNDLSIKIDEADGVVKVVASYLKK